MGLFIFLLLFFFIILPLGKILWRGWQFSRQWKRMNAQMRDAYRKASGEEQAGHGESPKKKKKIDPSVGEYVSFEELKVDTTFTEETTADGTKKTIHVESQIEEAVWEDIK